MRVHFLRFLWAAFGYTLGRTPPTAEGHRCASFPRPRPPAGPRQPVSENHSGSPRSAASFGCQRTRISLLGPPGDIPVANPPCHHLKQTAVTFSSQPCKQYLGVKCEGSAHGKTNGYLIISELEEVEGSFIAKLFMPPTEAKRHEKSALLLPAPADRAARQR